MFAGFLIISAILTFGSLMVAWSFSVGLLSWCFWHHHWQDWAEADGVYLTFGRPLGKARLQYCERCGAVRLARFVRKKEQVPKAFTKAFR